MSGADSAGSATGEQHDTGDPGGELGASARPGNDLKSTLTDPSLRCHYTVIEASNPQRCSLQ